ncbi:hypothetical protein Salpa_5625 [Sporomusa sp. KB1]|jgi:hypothetical protein|nr:hypothetical protein Salpa_5625 [Sporomusa sp. KB1]
MREFGAGYWNKINESAVVLHISRKNKRGIYYGIYGGYKKKAQYP